MRAASINWQPTPRQLRQFAACALVALPLIAWWWNISGALASGWIGAALALNALAWLRPAVVRPVYLAAVLLTLPLGIVIGELALLVIYFCVFVPIAVIFRVIGRDALQLRERQQASYWESTTTADAKSYFRQY